MARHVVQPIIRKKKKRGGDDGHHGGAWKIAYADFVTAMMAFFLLMWLINVTSPEQKTGIAEYFNPITVSQTTAGSGGVLDGASISPPGPLTSPTSEMRMQASLQLAPRSEAKTKSDTSSEKTGGGKTDDKDLERLVKEREQKQFKEVEEKLRKSIEAFPDLKAQQAGIPPGLPLGAFRAPALTNIDARYRLRLYGDLIPPWHDWPIGSREKLASGPDAPK